MKFRGKCHKMKVTTITNPNLSRYCFCDGQSNMNITLDALAHLKSDVLKDNTMRIKNKSKLASRPSASFDIWKLVYRHACRFFFCTVIKKWTLKFQCFICATPPIMHANVHPL